MAEKASLLSVVTNACKSHHLFYTGICETMRTWCHMADPGSTTKRLNKQKRYTMKTKATLFSLLTFMGLSALNAQVKVGDNPTNVDGSAVLELESSEKGFLPPRLTRTQRDAITTPAEGLLIYNTDTKCLQVYDGRFWISACDAMADVPTVIGANGVVWMDRNLGASQVATSSTDTAAYGDLYQWGRAADGHEKRDSDTYSAVLTTDGVANFNASGNDWDGEFILRNSGANNWVDPTITDVDDLWQGVNGTNNPCPTGYRVPTEAEWIAERQNWSNINAAGAFASSLKLPIVGNRLHESGSILSGDFGDYWTSTVSGTKAQKFIINSSVASTDTNNRAFGFAVRCLKDINQ